MLLVVPLSHAQAIQEPGFSAWSVEIESDRFLDPLNLNEIGRDDVWLRSRPQGIRNLGYAIDELRLRRSTFSESPSSVSLVLRQRSVAVASEGALSLLRQIESKSRPSTDATWNVAVDYLGFSGVGLELGQSWPVVAGWQVNVAVQGLALTQVSERHVYGRADYAAGSGQYRAQLMSQELKSDLEFPFQQPQASVGLGLLSHGGLRWFGEQFRASFQWRDAGVLHWRGLPRQTLRLDSDISSVDGEGFVAYAPLVSGQNSQPHYRRRVVPWRTLQASYAGRPDEHWTLGLDWCPGWGPALPRVGWQRRVGDLTLGLGLQTYQRRADVVVAWKGWRLSYGASGLIETRARTVGLAWTTSGP